VSATTTSLGTGMHVAFRVHLPLIQRRHVPMLAAPVLARVLPAALFAVTACAQVPDGYVVFGSFAGGTTTGQGIFFCHPRATPGPAAAGPTLPQSLSSAGSGSRGVAALLRRPTDGALIVGERAPAGASVDLHVLHLSGNSVVLAQLFSCGTSANVGEIPQ